MKAKEFNSLFNQIASEKLLPHGFQKKGTNYYLYNSPNLLVLKKSMSRDSFLGYNLCFTHDFLHTSKTKSGEFKIPGYIEDYPISIDILYLEELFRAYGKMEKFKYDLYFLTRQNSNDHESRIEKMFRLDAIQENQELAKKYVEYTIQIVLEIGLTLYNDFSPLTSLTVIQSYEKQNIWILNKFKDEITQYINENDLKPKKIHSCVDFGINSVSIAYT